MKVNGRNTGVFSDSLKYTFFTATGFGVLLLLGTVPVTSAQAASHMAISAPLVQEGHYKNYKVMAAGNRNDVVADHKEIGIGAQRFIDNMAQKGLGFLADDSIDGEQKKREFAKLLNDTFDMKTIGRFSLGRYWRVSTAEQRREYLDLFNDMVIQVYSDRFSEYSGQTFETSGHRRESEKDTIVTSYVSDDKTKVQVDWRVRHKNGHYKVVDVMVEGVSMSMTQRSDFSSVIQRGGGNVSVLLDHLRNQR